MPNVIANIYAGTPVTETIADETDRTMFQLGCVLPELVGNYEDLLDGQAINTRSVYSGEESPWLDRGVSWHDRTDLAYTKCQLTADLLNAIETDLEYFGASIYMGDLAVLGCAHTGTMMLLDGVLMKRSSVRYLYEQFTSSVLRSKNTVVASIDEPMAESIIKYLENTSPAENYVNPTWVSVTLQQSFSKKQDERSVFPEGATDLVDYCLTQQLSRLKANGHKIMQIVIKELSNTAASGSISSL